MGGRQSRTMGGYDVRGGKTWSVSEYHSEAELRVRDERRIVDEEWARQRGRRENSPHSNCDQCFRLDGRWKRSA